MLEMLKELCNEIEFYGDNYVVVNKAKQLIKEATTINE